MSEKKTSSRIWELDALRGLCILFMILIHLFFDLEYFAGIDLGLPRWFDLVQQYGHVFFILISGICATLASRSFQRGIYVFGCGLLISYVTLFAEVFFQMKGIRIWFGILHLLGVCMMLYPLFKKLPHWALAIIGLAFVALGFWMETVRVDVIWLFPIGLRSGTVFTGSDFFPLFPGFGWFLLGGALGKSVYRQKQSLLPKIRTSILPLRFLSFVGKHSLIIYLVHQPLLYGITFLFFM